MKKLKIFLLLSILLCLGFALSSEVHAQDDGPKIFEVDDVLPATTQLRIIVDIPNANRYWGGAAYTTNEYLRVYGYRETASDYDFDVDVNGSELTLSNYNLSELVDNEWVFREFVRYGIVSIIIDTSTWTETQRSIVSVSPNLPIYWEDLNAPSGYTITFNSNGGTTISDIEEATELPTLPTPTKENHIFLDWYYDSGFINKAFTGDLLTGDVTLYAKYAKMFQVGDVLPAGLVRISWDEDHPSLMRAYFLEHHQIKSNNNSFNFIERIEDNYYIAGINIMTLPSPGYPEFVPPYTGYGGGHSYVDVNTADWSILKRTISYVDWYTTTPNETNYDARLYWEDLTPDGYTQGYQVAKEYYGWEDDGHWYTGEEAWDMGNEYARERYGYYDPITDEWLSVSEYLDRYGTDKMDQTDFYNNFDKYFIPAMIIVFGGAIVLTVLKVFKGRE